jgi:carotenoid cleavage dioxygenase-like enzyme
MGGVPTTWAYNITSPQGRLSPDHPISLSHMLHDFAISENYAIFFDVALIFDQKSMRTGGMAFVTDFPAELHQDGEKGRAGEGRLQVV